MDNQTTFMSEQIPQKRERILFESAPLGPRPHLFLFAPKNGLSGGLNLGRGIHFRAQDRQTTIPKTNKACIWCGRLCLPAGEPLYSG